MAQSNPITNVPKVLLVDDDELILSTFGMFFDSIGWHYELASDGQEGLTVASAKDFDVVITDLMMPGMSGLELMEKLRVQKPGQAIMVITGSGSIDSVIQFLRQGAIDVILKPVDLESLRDSVERVTEVLHDTKREQEIYRFVAHEKTILRFKTSDIADIRMPFPILDRLWASGIVDTTQKMRLLLACQEALANSVEHGNLELESAWKEQVDKAGVDRYANEKKKRLAQPNYADRLIEIEIEFSGEDLSISIRDQGKGFDTSKCKSTTQSHEACVPAVFGRGIAIIEGTMDRISYKDGGRSITMSWSLPKRNCSWR